MMPKFTARQPFLFISFFALLLMAVLLFMQYRSYQSIRDLQKSNEMASATFEVNNSLQEIINDINEVENSLRLHIYNKSFKNTSGITDTIALMQKQVDAIQNLPQTEEASPVKLRLAGLVKKKKDLFNRVLSHQDDLHFASDMITSESNRALNDSIYFSAQQLQLQLENELQQSVVRNTKVSKDVLTISQVLTLISLLAILILATLIIQHLSKNIRLIKDLGIEKQKTLEAANVKEQFLANMSHEIRTPVNAIIGFTALIQKTQLRKDQEKFVDLIKTSGENLLKIINDILDISKIEAGMIQFDRRTFNVHELVNDVKLMFGHLMEEKHLEFSCSVDPDVPEFITGDDKRLSQILTNLVSNALKFTNEGSVSVYVSRLGYNDKEVSLKFNVKDTGIGIPQEKLQVIFERFEQADHETTRTFGGTGLGLSIVKKLVELQKGDIEVKSSPGMGSEFIFRLSYDLSKEPENKLAPAIEAEKSLTISPAVKILVAEDNKMNQLLLKYIFQQWGISFLLAENGHEATEMIKNHPFDLVLLDVQMPGMDGYAVARWIRGQGSKTPVIAMTAHVLPGEREKCLEAGMNDYLSKPIDQSELYMMLNKYLPNDEKAGNPQTYVSQAYLENLFSGDRQFIKNILQQFILQFPSETERLEAAIQESDIKMVKSIAHNLKTTVTSVNEASPLIDDLVVIEENNLKQDEIKRAVQNIISKKDNVIQEAETLLNSL